MAQWIINEGVALARYYKGGANPKGKALDFLVCLQSNPGVMKYGAWQKENPRKKWLKPCIAFYIHGGLREELHQSREQ